MLRALTVWGIQLLGERPTDDVFQARWLVHPLRARFRPEHATDMATRFESGGETIELVVSGAITMGIRPRRVNASRTRRREGPRSNALRQRDLHVR